MDFPVVIKSAYGRDLRYPVNSEQASAFSGLTGRKTVSDADLRWLSRLGFNVIEQEAS